MQDNSKEDDPQHLRILIQHCCANRHSIKDRMEAETPHSSLIRVTMLVSILVLMLVIVLMLVLMFMLILLQQLLRNDRQKAQLLEFPLLPYCPEPH